MSDSSTPSEPSRREIIERALATVSRVARDGGVGQVELPHPETGKHTLVTIDQTSARELLGWLLDSMAADLWKQIRDGKPLAFKDREFLRQWTDAMLSDDAASERERQIGSAMRRSQFRLVDGDQP